VEEDVNADEFGDAADLDVRGNKELDVDEAVLDE